MRSGLEAILICHLGEICLSICNASVHVENPSSYYPVVILFWSSKVEIHKKTAVVWHADAWGAVQVAAFAATSLGAEAILGSGLPIGASQAQSEELLEQTAQELAAQLECVAATFLGRRPTVARQQSHA